MKVKIRETFPLFQELKNLNKKELMIKARYFVEKNLNKLLGDLKDYVTQEKKLIEKYGDKKRIIAPQFKKMYEEQAKKLKTKKEKESLKEKFMIDDYEIKKGNEEKFKKDVEDLQSIEMEIEFHKIKIEDFGEIKLKEGEITNCIKLGLIVDGE